MGVYNSQVMPSKETSGNKNYTCYPGRIGYQRYIVGEATFAYNPDNSYPCENGDQTSVMYEWHGTTSSCYGFILDMGGGYRYIARGQNNGWTWSTIHKRYGPFTVGMYRCACNGDPEEGTLVMTQSGNIPECNTVGKTCTQTTNYKVTIADSAYHVVGSSFDPIIETNSPAATKVTFKNGRASVSGIDNTITF